MEMKNILVTGGNGYIGSVLTEVLLEKGYSVSVLDTDYYEGIDSANLKVRQINKDIRDVSEEDLIGIDAIVHLAALSNDPLGEFNKKLTKQINFDATIRLARLARVMGVKRFVYASSQSMYGVSDTENELEEDNSEKNPLTEYAKTKWDAECALKKMSSENFMIVCFRPSTVFGASPKLRCDVVFNNLVACGYTTGKIEIKSDGTPWRPVVHVRDVSSAFIAGLEAPVELVANESFNVGIENGNYTVKDLAEAAQKSVGGNCELIFTGEHSSDSRTYRVSFKKILTKLKNYYKPEWDLVRGGKELVELFDKVGFNEEMFRGRKCIRLSQLKHLIEQKELDSNFFWKNPEVNQAAILAGGLGTRLKPFTDTMPKPMIEINDRPFLEYLIESLKDNGIEEVVLMLGYLPEKIQEHFGDGSKFGVKIKYSVGGVDFNTGKRVKHAENLLEDTFLLMYADNYLPLNLGALRRYHKTHEAQVTMTVYSNKDKFTKDNVIVDKTGLISTYDRSREQKGLSGVDLGFFIMNKQVVRDMPLTNFPLYEIFPNLIENKKLAGYKTDHRYYSISKIERLPETSEYLKEKKVIFLDRDGTINKKSDQVYVRNWNEFEFLPGAKEAISLLTKEGYEIHLITNQAGIARGEMSEEELKEVHDNMLKEIELAGGKINKIYYCPHGWDAGCECRKPRPGMLFQAARENQINLMKAYFVGDDLRDFETGEAANVKTILIDEENNLLRIVERLVQAHKA